MRVIANRQLRGVYGNVVPDQEFEPSDDLAIELLKSGLVRHALPPKIAYDTKIIRPTSSVIAPKAPEASPRPPFRDVPVPDKKSADLATEGDPMFSAAELSSDRTTDPRGRGGRSRLASRG